jgi:hypothetical protein
MKTKSNPSPIPETSQFGRSVDLALAFLNRLEQLFAGVESLIETLSPFFSNNPASCASQRAALPDERDKNDG